MRGIEHARAGNEFKLPAEYSERQWDGALDTRTPPRMRSIAKIATASAGQNPSSLDGEQQQRRRQRCV